MVAFAAAYKPYLANKSFLRSSLLGVVLLVASVVANFYSGLYATKEASSPVTDFVLSNTRVFDVDGPFVYGSILFWVFIAFLCLSRPQRIPFITKSIALFTFIRSLFVSLTHIGPFPTQLVINSDILSWFSFGADLFFSGHTGLPFLMALIFWEDIRLRIFFIASAILFGIVVLLAHLHYSIDVLAAFFITHSIYRIAEVIFKKDQKIFKSGIQ